MALPVSIVSIGSFSPLGQHTEQVWQNYQRPETCFSPFDTTGGALPVARINEAQQEEVRKMALSDGRYKHLDPSVLYAMIASRDAIARAGWEAGENIGINIGSSRGATQLFEHHYDDFLKLGKVSPQASPATTLGNIASWVAADLRSSGPEISHSITCSTSLHAVLNGIAWLGSGLAERFLVGGAEAPLTPFTLAQMRAMKIYAHSTTPYPCRALDFLKKENTMVLGEGAAVACLEPGKKPGALAYIEGIGYATEAIRHGASISAEGDSLYKSMKMAMSATGASAVDAIVMHAPGTVKGDISEYKAIQQLFGDAIPLLTGNKWKVGHTFGASGMLSLEMAVLMLHNQEFLAVPYLATQPVKKPLNKILVNAVGFGGNAVSLLVSL